MLKWATRLIPTRVLRFLEWLSRLLLPRSADARANLLLHVDATRLAPLLNGAPGRSHATAVLAEALATQGNALVAIGALEQEGTEAPDRPARVAQMVAEIQLTFSMPPAGPAGSSIASRPRSRLRRPPPGRAWTSRFQTPPSCFPLGPGPARYTAPAAYASCGSRSWISGPAPLHSQSRT